MKSVLCLIALVAAASAQTAFINSFQYNISDSSCNTIKATFANVANTNGYQICYNNGDGTYSHKTCSIASQNQVVTYFSDSGCTNQLSGSNTTTLNNQCFNVTNTAFTPSYTIPERITCTDSSNAIQSNSVVFNFYFDSQCVNLYGIYSYTAGVCQISEGGYQFTLTSTGFNYLNYSDIFCSTQRGLDVASFTGDNACRTITQSQTGFAPTLYYRTSSTSAGPFAGVSTSTSASGSTTSNRNSAASVVANVVLVVVAAFAVMMM